MAKAMHKPVLQALVLADHVYQDRETGKHIIAGTFTQYNIRTPSTVVSNDETKTTYTTPLAQVGSPFLYLALLEVHGEVQLGIEYVKLSDASIVFEAKLRLTATDPCSVAEVYFPLPPEIFKDRDAGHYSLDVQYDGELLGSWRVLINDLRTKSKDAGESV